MASPFVQLFGSDLTLHSKKNPGGAKVSSLGELKAVFLYFSANWCPPCRGFTPVLKEYYNKFGEKKGFEVIFVSSDKDQASFDEYYDEQPWLALPFSERELKNKLAQKFKVSGIPMLIVLDNKANVITTNGRAKVSEDKECELFPWATETFDQMMAGDLKSSKGGVFSYASLVEKNTAIGFYFSAHWCPPCRGFTPQLAFSYQKMKAAGKPFEVIFVTSDQDEGEYNQYLAEMPWLALPFGDKRCEELSSMYNVSGIPTLIIAEPKTGKVITANGRAAVSADPEGNDFPWTPKALENVNNAADEINQSACLLYLNDTITEEDKTALNNIAAVYHDQWKAIGKDRAEFPLLFFYGSPSDGVGERVLNFTGVNKKPVLMILNLPKGNKFVSTETNNFGSFVFEFLSGSLTPKGIKEKVN